MNTNKLMMGLMFGLSALMAFASANYASAEEVTGEMPTSAIEANQGLDSVNAGLFNLPVTVTCSVQNIHGRTFYGSAFGILGDGVRNAAYEDARANCRIEASDKPSCETAVRTGCNL